MLRKQAAAGGGGGGALAKRDGLDEYMDENAPRYMDKAVKSAAKKIRQEAIDTLGEGHPDIPTLREAAESLEASDVLAEARILAREAFEKEVVSKAPSAKKQLKQEMKFTKKEEARKTAEEEREVAEQNEAEEEEEMEKADIDSKIHKLEMRADQMLPYDESLLRRLKEERKRSILAHKVDQEISRALMNKEHASYKHRAPLKVLGGSAKVVPHGDGRMKVAPVPVEELDEYPDPD